MELLYDSLKFERSGRHCRYIHKKGLKAGKRCGINLCVSNSSWVCTKHTKYEDEVNYQVRLEKDRLDRLLEGEIKETRVQKVEPYINKYESMINDEWNPNNNKDFDHQQKLYDSF